MNDTTPKQQIVDKIKNATNILVTVSKNPNVDELSSAIGLTLMLNKLGKHATAVFSGAMPPAITFLDPEKTLENTVDSLRDFIIALDKEKADRLRYRVEDDVVRIFITPYRTKISQDDLQFTHGDFNVELVLALGVENQDELDDAIAAHGKILHDATVATLSARDKKSTLGSIDWQDAQASSLSEMLVAISESIKGQDAILDEQIATALLTGIVSATHRFSNDHTSPKAMTMAAQLMAAGANQQLIASQLEESESTPETSQTVQKNSDGSITLAENEVEDIKDAAPEQSSEEPEESETAASKDLGEMTIAHDDGIPADTAPKDQSPEGLPMVESATIEEHDQRNKKLASEAALDEALKKLNTAPTTGPTLAELEADVRSENQAKVPAEKPRMGSAFNAMAQEAEALRGEQNASDIPSDQSSIEPPVSTKAPTLQPIHGATLAELEEEAKQHAPSAEPAAPSLPSVDSASAARQEVEELFATSPAPIAAPSPVPDTITPPPPAAPPLPDFSTLPPLPPTPTDIPAPVATPAAPPAPDQFRIPGA